MAADITPVVIDQLHEAFTTIGFVITNHGVEEKVRAPLPIGLQKSISSLVNRKPLALYKTWKFVKVFFISSCH